MEIIRSSFQDSQQNFGRHEFDSIMMFYCEILDLTLLYQICKKKHLYVLKPLCNYNAR